MPKHTHKIRLIEPKPPGCHVFSNVPIPRLGLPIMGAILKRQGFDVRIYCQAIQEIDFDDLYRADAVGISTTTSTAPLAYKLADDLAERGIPVVIGGPHTSFLPDESLRHAPYCVRGEGERSFPELLRCIFSGEEPQHINGVSYIHNGEIKHNPPEGMIGDLDAFPFPDLNLIQGSDRIRMRPVLTSRGCPFDCTFCSVTEMFGRRYRVRSVENVIEELKIARPREILFYDDNFTANRTRAKELCESMLRHEINAHWGAQVRTDVAEDTELLSLMRRSGCDVLYIGLESVNPETLRAFNKRQQVEDIENCIRKLHEHNILVHGMFIAGSDEDDLNSIDSTVDFALKNNINTIQISMLTPLPGTKFYEDMKSQGRIINDDWSLYDGHHLVFRPKNMSPYDLQTRYIAAQKRFYSISGTLTNLLHGKFINAFIRCYAHHQLTLWEKSNKPYLASLADY